MANTAHGMDVGKMALQGFGQVMDSMDLVKRAWSNFSLATPFTPTVSVEELDKRITELRAVEQWLTLNQNLLRNTIQGLEVQRGTLDAISTMSKSFGEMAKPADEAMARFAAAAAQKAAANPPEAGASAAPAPAGGVDWSPFSMPSSMFNRPAADAPSGAASPGGEPGAPPAAAAAPDAGAGKASSASAPGGEAAAPQAGAMNPMAWWDMLQANFRQIAEAATAQQNAFGASSAGAPGDATTAGEDKSRQSPRGTRQAAGAKRTPARKAGGGKTAGAGKAGSGGKGKTAPSKGRRTPGAREPE